MLYCLLLGLALFSQEDGDNLERIIIMGLFGNLFDFNGDGKLDSFERAAEFGMFMQMIDSEKNDELTSAGLDPSELENMGYFERREALEEAGLAPDDYE